MVAWDKNKEGARVFGIYPTFDEFWTNYLKNKPDKRWGYEIVLHDKLVNFHMDIEYWTDKADKEHAKLLMVTAWGIEMPCNFRVEWQQALDEFIDSYMQARRKRQSTDGSAQMGLCSTGARRLSSFLSSLEDTTGVQAGTRTYISAKALSRTVHPTPGHAVVLSRSGLDSGNCDFHARCARLVS